MLKFSFETKAEQVLVSTYMKWQLLLLFNLNYLINKLD